MLTVQQWAIRWQLPQQAMHELQAVLGASVPPISPGNPEATSEAATQQMVRLRMAQSGGIAWRNNSGATADETGRVIRFGLGNDSMQINRVMKSSDLIGITPVVVKPEHIGWTVGIFTAIECKAPNWKFRQSDDRAVAQFNFIKKVIALGGIGKFVTRPEDV